MPPKFKKRRHFFKFSYLDIEKLFNLKPRSLRYMIYSKKINLHNLETFISFINYLKSKQEIEN